MIFPLTTDGPAGGVSLMLRINLRIRTSSLHPSFYLQDDKKVQDIDPCSQALMKYDFFIIVCCSSVFG